MDEQQQLTTVNRILKQVAAQGEIRRGPHPAGRSLERPLEAAAEARPDATLDGPPKAHGLDSVPGEPLPPRSRGAFLGFWAALRADVEVIYKNDPAVKHWLEVVLCYPGLQALVIHRIAHGLYRQGIPVLPRFISHLSRWLTGIEIHPGAQMGRGVFIDHGMGVVIGETAIVGDGARIYQGATLGGTGKEQGKRHPTLGCHVTVGAGAKVLGNIQIGDHARIGAGSVVLRDVPSHCTAVGIPARLVRRGNSKIGLVEQNDGRDVEAEVISALFERIKGLEQEVRRLGTVADAAPLPIAGDGGPGRSPVALDGGPAGDAAGRDRGGPGQEDLLIQEFLDGAGI